MLETFLLRSALWTSSAVLGSLGVFCVVRSFSVPWLGGHALVLLGVASAITFSLGR
jgi:hypothetical protein